MTKTFNIGDWGDFKKEKSMKLMADVFDTTVTDEVSLPSITMIKDTDDLLKKYGDPSYINTVAPGHYFSYTNEYTWATRIPDINIGNQVSDDTVIKIQMPDGSTESLTKSDLVKYLSERKLVQENELVRKVYDRYQVAVKLARSDDDGTGN